MRDDPATRKELLGRLDCYLDVPLALASIALVLIAVIEVERAVAGQARHFIISVVSVLMALDAKPGQEDGIELSDGEALRSIIKKAEGF